jgi:hypothetical protein
VGEHVGGFQPALLEADEVASPGTRLDRHRNILRVHWLYLHLSMPVSIRPINLFREPL